MAQARPAVLIIDEHEPTQELYRRVLSSQYDITLCTSIDEATLLLDTQVVEVLILEPNFLHDEGWRFLASLRASAATQALPVIVCSALDDRRRAGAAQIDAYLVKPVLPQLLVETIQRALATG